MTIVAPIKQTYAQACAHLTNAQLEKKAKELLAEHEKLHASLYHNESLLYAVRQLLEKRKG